jgi:hypothetical protein
MEHVEQLKTQLNSILTCLTEGAEWHRRAGNECRKLHVRGWGRWHEAEAECDAKAAICLSKLCVDIPDINIVPSVHNAYIQKAQAYQIRDMIGFKEHHDTWVEREQAFINVLNEAIALSRDVDIKLYEYLCKLCKEVQNEKMRVEWTVGRLSLADWHGHDLGVCSMVMHDYFEHKYDGGEIDFNIG